MNNKLHLCAGRRRAVGTFHPYKAPNGSRTRVRHSVAVLTQQTTAPLSARWSRNAVTGALECHWAPEASTEPHPRMKAVRRIVHARMHRRSRSAGLRPPSRLYIHG
ncbi:hypothetical protein [Dyella terrae]|uniref:hypothetical protein n=1 Tax=Dyella terrae TaxID=522259 RepID=UPI001EFCB1AA|nr:hypothetical protein [Dyella terrae]ULU24474.1 hypothetical protein DYST_01390 [Dyella terrae]